MWTRRRTDPEHWQPEVEGWLVLYADQPCGSVWGHSGRWFWVSWTSPAEAGEAASLAEACGAVRAAVLRTDGLISPFRMIKGADFPEDRRRAIRM